MPIYEYQCQSCQHQLEALQKMSDAPLEQCPECDKPALRKKVSAAAFRLKGGGWYETDFKTGDKKNLANDGSGDKKGGDKTPSKDSGGKDGSSSTSSSKSSSTKNSAAAG